MAETRKSLKVRVRGRVQGVYFRGWTKGEADRLGLDGWVRNEADGSVAALLSGAAPAVEEMVRLLHRGPPAARVDSVQVEDIEADAPARGFEIRR
jgi:acylphosphatase